MKIKKLLGQLLAFLSVSMITFAPTSASSIGVEEMPESMKKLR
jgi:hypothetical protein